MTAGMFFKGDNQSAKKSIGKLVMKQIVFSWVKIACIGRIIDTQICYNSLYSVVYMCEKKSLDD
jgi:hypothetical protein